MPLANESATARYKMSSQRADGKKLTPPRNDLTASVPVVVGLELQLRHAQSKDPSSKNTRLCQRLTRIDNGFYASRRIKKLKMNVNLTPELENLINEKVTSGLYNSASEVVRDALRLLREQGELRRIRQDELRKEVRRGIDASAQGRVKDGNEAMAAIKKDLTQRKKR
jgi:antitoxin ParD1/3/4